MPEHAHGDATGGSSHAFPAVVALTARIAAVEGAERVRQAAMRARFEAGFGHPRGPAVVGDEGTFWRAEEAANPADTDAADAVGADAIGAYLVAGPSDRDALRAAYAAAPFCRWRLGWAVALADGRPGPPTDGDPGAGPGASGGSGGPPGRPPGRELDRVLAAATLRVDGSDVRDLIVTLDHTCLDALRRGADPFPAISGAVDRARDVGGGETTASRLLATYLEPARRDSLDRAGRQG